MTAIGGVTGGASPVEPSPGGRVGSGANDSFAMVLEAFKEQATKTPVERAREAVLERHRISEEEYQRLPPSERAAIDKEIVDAVRTAAQKLASNNRTASTDGRFD
jgi:hypothetical protein